jgi:hypothetical protein
MSLAADRPWNTSAGCGCVVGKASLLRKRQRLWSCELQVQKSAEHYTEAAQDEIDLLAAIAGHAHRSAEGASACVRMLDHFEHRGPHGRHVCMVFEVRRRAWLLLPHLPHVSQQHEDASDA